MAKKERRSLKDKKRARRLKGLIPSTKKEKSQDTKIREGVLWKQRKDQGQAGMAGSGRGKKIPSKNLYNRQQKHKGKNKYSSLYFLVIRRYLENQGLKIGS